MAMGLVPADDVAVGTTDTLIAPAAMRCVGSPSAHGVRVSGTQTVRRRRGMRRLSPTRRRSMTAELTMRAGSWRPTSAPTSTATANVPRPRATTGKPRWPKSVSDDREPMPSRVAPSRRSAATARTPSSTTSSSPTGTTRSRSQRRRAPLSDHASCVVRCSISRDTSTEPSSAPLMSGRNVNAPLIWLASPCARSHPWRPSHPALISPSEVTYWFQQARLGRKASRWVVMTTAAAASVRMAMAMLAISKR